MLKWTHKASLALLFLTALTIPSYKAGAVTAASISRSQAEQRALNMINLTWSYDKSKNIKLNGIQGYVYNDYVIYVN